MDIYNKILRLCSQNGISLSKLCLELGLSKNTGYNWKKGSIPNKAALYKICDYFNISIDYFNEDNDDVKYQEKLDAEIKFALFGTPDVPDDIYKQVKDFAKYLKEKKGE